MWPDFERLAGSGGTLAFHFPQQRPPAWRQRWQALVQQVTVTRTHDAKDALLDDFANGSGVRTLGFVNAHAFNSCVDSPEFARDLLALDHIVRDGIGVSTLYRLIGSHSGLNLNGTDLLPELIARFAGKRIAIFGTRLPLLEAVAAKLKHELGAEVIIADGFQPDGHYLRLVAKTRPALVVLGMGMPKQERVARQMKHGLNQDVAIVCGGAILDFLSGHKPRAPQWMRVAGLEWIYRLSLEPKRLFGRYVIGNPLFLLRSALLALRPKPAASRERSLPERRPITEPYGLGGPVIAISPARGEPLPGSTFSPPGNASESPPHETPHLLPEDWQAAGSARNPADALQPRQSAVSVFSANRPVVARNDLFGRQRDLERLLAWVLDQNGNALIYGPRGYGKTSLVRVFGEIADSRDHVVIYASCSRNIDFDGLIRSYLEELPESVPPAALAAAGPLGVKQVATLLANVTGASIILIIDEFDRIERDDTRQNIIELIKDVSDLTASVRFVLVGVATDATTILGYHPSVQRCITCLPLSRLAPEAIADMFDRKARTDQLVIGDRETETVVQLSAGSAYHAQLIGQKLVSEARQSGRNVVQPADLDRVVDDIIADASLMDDGFSRLTRLMRGAESRAALIHLARLALAGSGDLIGLPDDDPGAVILRGWCNGLVEMGVLQAVDDGSDVPTYRFKNAFVPQLLLMVDHRNSALQVSRT